MIVLQRSAHVFDNHFKVSLASNNRFSILSLILYLHCMCSFNNSSNQAMGKKLLTEAQAVFSEKKWMKSTVKGKPLSYFFKTQAGRRLFEGGPIKLLVVSLL